MASFFLKVFKLKQLTHHKKIQFKQIKSLKSINKKLKVCIIINTNFKL